MKFIADAMLGRLAKRLRLLGFDVLYDPELDDNAILRLSLEQHRTILTRDNGLARRPLASNHIFIVSDKVECQIEQVLASTNIELPPPLTRCSVCNALLVPIPKQDASDFVPPYVYNKFDAFMRCKNCGRLYWKGSHIRKTSKEKSRR